MKHASWDGGAIRVAFGSLAILIPQKTSKTRCDKRVAMSQIDDVAPTCPKCRAAIEAERRAMQSLGITSKGD